MRKEPLRGKFEGQVSGNPRGYKIFEGNRHVSATVDYLIDKMDPSTANPIVSGLWTVACPFAENLELLEEECRSHIICPRKSRLEYYSNKV